MKKLTLCVSVLALTSMMLFAEDLPFKGRTLTIITFASEFKDQGFVADFEKLTGAKVDLQIVPNENFEAKMAPLLKTGKGVPDVFTGEAGYVKEYVESGVWETLNKAPYNASTKDMFPYVTQLGSNAKGELKALSWQTTPGGWFYRRSMAKKYFGTDDPAEIAKLFATWDSTLAAAEVIKTKSNGTAYMFSGLGDGFSRVFTSNRKTPWVDAKKNFSIDPQITEYFKTAKKVRDAGYDAKLADWSGPFFEAMNTPADKANIFMFSWPTWGLHFVLNGQTASNGDWAVVPAPKPYFWGGTFLGIYKNSPNKDVAWAFIKMLTQDKAWMETYAKKSGDFMSDKVLDKAIAPYFTGKEASLGPKDNHYEFFMQQAATIDGSMISSEDRPLMAMLTTVLNEYVEGKKDLDTAMADFKGRVKAAYPRWNVK